MGGKTKPVGNEIQYYKYGLELSNVGQKYAMKLVFKAEMIQCQVPMGIQMQIWFRVTDPLKRKNVNKNNNKYANVSVRPSISSR